MGTPEEKKLLGAKWFKGKEGGGEVWVFLRNTQSKRALQKIILDFKLKKSDLNWLVGSLLIFWGFSFFAAFVLSTPQGPFQ